MSAQGDCEFLVKRARDLVQGDLWAAKAWLITARSLYPADFNIQLHKCIWWLKENVKTGTCLPHELTV
uniref:Integrator complex subunit 10 n=1 Tax=Gopherus evgoodei TaxID=1825980 RepID=A0A8C4WG96_9SAUR